MNERPKGSAPELDPFLRDLAALPELDAPAAQLAAALAADQVVSGELETSDLRARLMAALPHTSRFERFSGAVAQLLDIERTRAQQLLDQLDNRSLFYELMPGIELFWVEGGPRVENAVRGFVRVAAGQDIPEHEHFGEEHMLVLQGAFLDPTRNQVFRPGDISVMSPGTSHLHIVPADGPDLLMLSIVHAGVSVGGQQFLPNQVPTK